MLPSRRYPVICGSVPEAQQIKALALVECGRPPENAMSQEVKLKQKAVRKLSSQIQSEDNAAVNFCWSSLVLSVV